ncbi:MAG: DUF3718 domain-containing protein [Ferrimonas sp.]
MKTEVVMVGLMLGLTQTVLAHPHPPQFAATDKQLSTSICIDAASKGVVQFHQRVKQERLQYRNLANNVRCNSLPIAAFAAAYNPDKRIAARLKKYER